MISNATQLKYILLHAPRHKYVEATIALITLSILLQVSTTYALLPLPLMIILILSLWLTFPLQVIIGIILIFQGRWNINYRGDQRKADIANNIVVILIFLVTVVNVMASAFGPSELPSSSHQSNSATTSSIAFLPASVSPNSPWEKKHPSTYTHPQIWFVFIHSHHSPAETICYQSHSYC